MSIPIIKLKNIDTITRRACGIQLDPNEEIEINQFEKLALSQNDDFVKDYEDGYFSILYNDETVPEDRGLAVLRNNIYVKIDGQDLGFAHTIDFKGIFGTVGYESGGNIEVETSASINIENNPELAQAIDGYINNFDFSVPLAHIYSALDAYITYEEADIKVKVSDQDNSSGFLEEKIINGAGIEIIKQTDGYNESLKISSIYNLDGYLDENNHRNLDQLVHNIAEECFEEITYGIGNKIDNIIIWKNSGKTIKIREEQYSYDNSNRINQIIIYQYNDVGIEIERMYETFYYNENKVSSITRNIVL